MSDNEINKLFKGKWYVVNSYSGHEEKVKKDLIKRVKNCNIDNYIFDIRTVRAPVVNKKTKKLENKNSFPGYIFVNAIMNDEAWFVIRNTTGVTGFIGSSGKGIKPTPLAVEEAEKMLKINVPIINEKATESDIEFKINDFVIITSGLFINESGKVKALNFSKRLATVEMEIFGRTIPTKIDFSNCKKINK